MFYTWVQICGKTSLEDGARSGRSLDATDEEMCKTVRDLVYSERQIQAEEKNTGIGHFTW